MDPQMGLLALLFILVPAVYFLYGWGRFFVAWRRSGLPRQARLWAHAGFGGVASSAVMWVVVAIGFGMGPSPSGDFWERSSYYAGIALCLFSFLAARQSKARAAPAIVVGGLLVAFLWITSVMYD